MESVGNTLRLCFIFSVFFSACFVDHVRSLPSPAPELQILKAERLVDLSSHIVRVALSLKVENIGTSPASEVLLAFVPEELDHLAWIHAGAVTGKKKKKKFVPLGVKPINVPHVDGPSGTKHYSVTLVNEIGSGESVTLEVLYVLTHSLEPFPVEKSQSESQLVYYRNSAFVPSPYPIKTQETSFRTPTSKVESFTRVDPTDRSGTELKYGPYDDRTSYSYDPIRIHFENNNPFAVVEELVREIEISHWGNLQITEHYKLTHGGARQKGGFSRIDYVSRQAMNAVSSSFKHLLAELPPRIHSVYYRDSIGNISTSRLRIGSKKSELLIEPRYPLIGGWKATFVIGYGAPLQDFLFESTAGSRFLNISFGCPLAETVVDKLIVKVVLPEGSEDPSVVIPFQVEQSLEKKYSYLDVVGRTVVVLEKRNVVPDHNTPFQVHYKFNPIFMLAEPLMLVSAFFLIFMTSITYLHMDLAIHKS